MRGGTPSRTAEHNALFRALESSRSEGRRLFSDPFASQFLTWPLSAVSRLVLLPGMGALVRWFIDRRWPGVRSSVIARTRFIDDAIGEAIDWHTGQVVVLGAGYDSRALRLPSLAEVTVFEVDHPDTQTAKRQALAYTRRPGSEQVRYVASDFNHRQLDAAMAVAGFREVEPTIFIWEGVTNYLDETAVDATLRWVARAATGSVLIFTYVHIDVLTDPAKYLGADRLSATLAHVGEQLTWGMDPAEMPEFLRRRGLTLECDIGAAEYRELYFGDGARAMRGHEFYRVAVARVS